MSEGPLGSQQHGWGHQLRLGVLLSELELHQNSRPLHLCLSRCDAFLKNLPNPVTENGNVENQFNRL